MLRRLKDLEDCTIGATDGDIGKVEDFYFDDHAWVVRYLVVETGSWLSSRKVLISPISVRKHDWASHTLPVAITRAQVASSPDIDTDRPVSRQHEERLLDFYGYSAYWGGYGLWGGAMIPMAMHPGYVGLPGDAAQQEAAVEENVRAEQARHRDDDPNLRSCKSVIGYHLEASDGEVGHVDGLLLDEDTWAIRYLIVNTSNWWGGHQVLIAPQWIEGVHWAERTVTVAMTRDAVKAAPPYDPSTDLDRQGEDGLYTHYGRMPYWKGGSAIERQS
jgi:uncharacterized protein YrrD